MGTIGLGNADIAKIAQSQEGRAALEKHVQEIIDGPAFKGSPRSVLFLKHVVSKVIAGDYESLKERMIGSELFGRSPSYATGEDAIVRVTANHVRKRLAQHYSRYRTASDFRIKLHSGSYIPEIVCEDQSKLGYRDDDTPHGSKLAPPGTVSHQDSESASVSAQDLVPITQAIPTVATAPAHAQSRRRWLTLIVLLGASSLLLFCLLLYAIMLLRSAPGKAVHVSVRAVAPPEFPWSVFFSSPNPTHLITSDTDLVAIQNITHSPVSVSDYANHNYIPESKSLPSQIKEICSTFMRGDKVSASEMHVVTGIKALAQSNSREIDVQTARSLEFFNLKTDDNFIFLGSPRSDPWFSLFDKQLDFRFVSDKEGLESVRDVHPRGDEQSSYIPTSKHGRTGYSYAIVALVQNPNQNGQVLLLSGTNAGGTMAAGKLVTDLPRLSMTLRNCGISPSTSLKHFELLLRVNMMASSAGEYDVVVCHILPEI